MEPDFLALPASPDRAKLDAVLSADGARERARGLRKLLVGLLAVLGVPLWIAAVWPRAFSWELRALGVNAFALGLVALGGAGAWEWACHRRRAWRIAQMGPAPTCSKGVLAGACAAERDGES